MRWIRTSLREAREAEHALLRYAGLREAEVRDVPCGPSPKHTMHTVSCGSPDAPPMVLLHGYAAGIGFYFKNLAPLSHHFRLHAVDWLGWGLSGRPPFNARSTAEAEDFFLHALERWRQEMGIERFILVGHSLGGYLSAVYALRHPERVEKLLLLGPAGVPAKPADFSPEAFRKRANVQPYTLRSLMVSVFPRLWNAGVTPGAVVRLLGPVGRSLTEGYTSRRFVEGHGFTEAEKVAFSHYMYHITASPGSGEYALRHLLEPFAWAKEPIGPRVSQLKVPTSFFYGDSDWMRPECGTQAVEAARAVRKPLSPTDLTVQIIPKAGHFVFLDQPAQFHEAVLRACRPHMVGRKPGQAWAACFSKQGQDGVGPRPSASTWQHDAAGRGTTLRSC